MVAPVLGEVAHVLAEVHDLLLYSLVKPLHGQLPDDGDRGAAEALELRGLPGPSRALDVERKGQGGGLVVSAEESSEALVVQEKEARPREAPAVSDQVAQPLRRRVERGVVPSLVALVKPDYLQASRAGVALGLQRRRRRKRRKAKDARAFREGQERREKGAQ